jgi:hypothetical protein
MKIKHYLNIIRFFHETILKLFSFTLYVVCFFFEFSFLLFLTLICSFNTNSKAVTFHSTPTVFACIQYRRLTNINIDSIFWNFSLTFLLTFLSFFFLGLLSSRFSSLLHSFSFSLKYGISHIIYWSVVEKS